MLGITITSITLSNWLSKVPTTTFTLVGAELVCDLVSSTNGSGEPGQNACKGFGGNLANAQKEWKSKFRAKTKNDWDVIQKDPSKFKSFSGLYTLLEMDHNEDDAAELEEALDAIASKNKSSTPKKVRPCTLPSETQSLLKVIFDNGLFCFYSSDLLRYVQATDGEIRLGREEDAFG